MKALITGASSGIGRDIARELAARGIDLVLAARRVERMEALARELPVAVEVVGADLADEAACHALFERARDVDIVVNNAGLGLFGPFVETDLARELSLLDVNVRALHILTKLYAKEFAARGSGYILNVASSAAFAPGPLLAAYYASKAYVLRLSEAVYEEMRRAGGGVQVSVLCPGPVRTEFDEVADVKFSVKGLESRKVAAYAVKKLFAGKLVIIPGVQMKLVRFAERFLSEKLLARLAWHMQKRKT